MKPTYVTGFASPAADMLSDTISLDRYLVKHPLNTMFVEMTGDAMCGVIEPGDLVIVERAARAAAGRIVLAKVDGEYMIRYLARDANGFYLQAANPRVKPLRPTNNLAIVGTVTGLARRFTVAADSDASDSKRGASSDAQRAVSDERRASSGEQQASSSEQRVAGDGQRAACSGQRASRGEQSAAKKGWARDPSTW